MPATKENVGAGEPDAVNGKLYAEPAIPAGGAALVITGGVTAMTLNETLCCAVPFAFVAVTVKLDVPTSLDAGVPLSTPVLELTVTQPGSVPVTAHPFAGMAWDAVNVCEYETFGGAVGGATLVIVGRLEMVTL